MARHDHAGIAEGTSVAPARLTVDHGHGMPPPRAFERGAETDDTGTEDDDLATHGLRCFFKNSSRAFDPKGVSAAP